MRLGKHVFQALFATMFLLLILFGCKPGTPPTAAFSATPTSGTAPLTVNFFDDSISGSSPITAWLWDFGDGTSSTLQNPTHVYESHGTYTVSLIVTSKDGENRKIVSDYIVVMQGAGEGEGEGEVEGEEQTEGEGDAGQSPPTANFTMNFSEGQAPLIVQFEDTSNAGSSAITNWNWDFGEPAKALDPFQNPSYVYNDPGTYNVTLTARG